MDHTVHGEKRRNRQTEDVPPSGVDGLANLLRDLHRDDVVAVDVLVVEPPVRRSHKVLGGNSKGILDLGTIFFIHFKNIFGQSFKMV